LKTVTKSSTSVFTLCCSWHESSWLYESLAFAAEGDAILLMQDAVLALHSLITLGSFAGKCEAAGIKLYALQEDCLLRGIKNQYATIQTIDYAGFVDLVASHDKQVAW